MESRTVDDRQVADDMLDRVLESAADAFEDWSASPAEARAAALGEIAERLDRAVEELVPIAHRETNLDQGRLRSELGRTTFQLRLFAEALLEGSYLDSRIDHADAEWPMGAPRPDIRRVLEPLGPVVVFSASNFPFAFSVAGGDTASALAAGCPVIVKAHSGHPELSRATADIVLGALSEVGAPRGLFSLIFGTEAGRSAIVDPRVRAGAFTGSIQGGRALFDLANSRPGPIPFFAEMGSLNPNFVTRAADRHRGEEIARGFLASMTLGSGQFCTKPGLLVLPRDSETLRHLRTLSRPSTGRLLNDRLHRGYLDTLKGLASHPDVRLLDEDDDTFGDAPSPTLLMTEMEDVLRDPEPLLIECFGPASLLVCYDEESALLDLATIMEGQLTATIHAEDEDDLDPLIRVLARRAGRLLWNQWPTGVSVTYAQQHGGPYPATTIAGSTSVGTAAILRFLRPVAYQGFPDRRLPAALQEANPLGIPRRVDGVLQL
jgi:NADP-dependent aldehyde dehydrogenase